MFGAFTLTIIENHRIKKWKRCLIAFGSGRANM